MRLCVRAQPPILPPCTRSTTRATPARPLASRRVRECPWAQRRPSDNHPGQPEPERNLQQPLVKLGNFDDALRAVRRSGLNCPVVDRLGHASTELRSCALRVDADERAVDTAREALDTWATHVEDMDMMQMGHLSPADATQAWLASWEQGVQEIQAHQGAARAARQAGNC